MKDNNSNNIETNNLTTEEFHKLLAENTTNQNELRFYYAQQLADIQDKYNKDLDKIIAQEHHENDELRKARKEYERAKEEYELNIRSLKKDRNDAGRRYNVDKAKLKNYWVPRTRRSRASDTTYSSAIEILGGHSREIQKVSCTQAGPETRKEG